MKYSFKAVYSFALTITLTSSLYGFNHVEANKLSGFSVKLMHRDSPKSPFYDAKETPAQRLANAFRRSINRVNHRFLPTNNVFPDSWTSLTPDGGEYLLKISPGSAGFEAFAVADTGSDIIWIQCQPCTNCYPQDFPIFDPTSSTTYTVFPCDSNVCNALGQPPRCSQSNSCEYYVQYGDLSYTSGELASDTMTLDLAFTLVNAMIGCGHNNGGAFRPKTSGIVGLGRGQFSLISQLGSNIGWKFSQCLVPFTSQPESSGTLSFGVDAVVSGSGTVSTPIVSGSSDTFYYLSLDSFVVYESLSIPYKTGFSSASSEGNMIIDSGSTLTRVPRDFFERIAAIIDQATGGTRTQDPNGILNLCYVADTNFKVPPISARFTNGAEVRLNPDTTFLNVAQGVMCFTFKPYDNDFTILGNMAQSNLLIGYDLEAKILSFKPVDCTTV